MQKTADCKKSTALGKKNGVKTVKNGNKKRREQARPTSGETFAVDFVGRVVAFPLSEKETNRDFADRQLVAEDVQ